MIFEISVYYLSCLPLWLSIFFIDVVSLCRGTEHGWTEWLSIDAILLATAMCGIYTYLWIKGAETPAGEKYIIDKAKEERFAAVEFMMSYVFPLFAFEFTQWDGVVLFLIFFGCFGFLVHRHRIFSTNPVMELLGYRVYECDLKPYKPAAGKEKIKGQSEIFKKSIVSRHELDGMPGCMIRTKIINNDYQFETEFTVPDSEE